jgi:hypothetical protein
MGPEIDVLINKNRASLVETKLCAIYKGLCHILIIIKTL